MEVEGLEVANGAKIHLTSAAAFVEAGSQDALDDACSICLEAFCDSNPSTKTSCKHELHLQCVLEWCQRSSNCPMCWQAITMKDPSSQELLEMIEKERILRSRPVRNAAVFHHPMLGDFELQHLPVGVDASELEDRIMQHLAAAAAVGRTRRLAIARREGLRSSSSAQTNPQLVVSSLSPSEPFSSPVSDTVNEPPSSASIRPRPIPRSLYVNQPIQPVIPSEPAGSWSVSGNNSRSPASEASTMNSTDAVGSSELQSASEKWKSLFSSMSMKYKESISRSTREWKEKLFSRNSTIPGIGSDDQRQVNAGVASVSGMMERMDMRENQAAPGNPRAQGTSDGPNADHPSFFAATAT